MPRSTPKQGPPDPGALVKSAAPDKKPLAIVLAGHNGSGKSTLWYAKDKLADTLQLPLVNADRLTMSILPELDKNRQLRPWAARFRDNNAVWQRLSQAAVQQFVQLVVKHQMPFAYETVFSYLKQLPDGSVKSRIEDIQSFQKAGYFVVLLFVGLATVDLSVLRVKTRYAQGGHDVPDKKLKDRFPRTQEAVRMAAPIADMALMFDNSRSIEKAFTLVRVQTKEKVQYDCRDNSQDKSLLDVASLWLSKVAPRD